MTHTKDEWVNSVMEQAQVFASAWSLVGSRFDSGNEMENAEEQKKALRAMLTTPPAAHPAVPDAMTSADIQEHIEYVAGWNDCRQAMLEMMK
jgi:hypothetical protein